MSLIEPVSYEKYFLASLGFKILDIIDKFINFTTQNTRFSGIFYFPFLLCKFPEKKSRNFFNIDQFPHGCLAKLPIFKN